MTVIKRRNSYWVDIGFNHKRYRRRSPDNSYQGAKAYEQYLRQRLARGEPLIEPEAEKRNTFKEIALHWLELDVKNNNKPSEYYNKKNVLKNTLIPYFGNMYIDEIATQNIEHYKSELLRKRNLSPKSVNNYLSILSKCLKSALETEFLKTLPRIKRLKVPPQSYDYLSEAETNILLDQATGKWCDMILLAVKTGLRFGELIALKWKDIDFKAGTLTVSRNIVHSIEGSPKNNRARIIPLTNEVIEMLCRKEKDNEYIFCNSNREPLHYTYCRKKLHRFCKLAGIRIINWHTLRHSFASHLAARGVSVFAIKDLLGHSDIKMTMRYSHVNLPVLRNAIDALEPINGTLTAQPHVIDSKSAILLPMELQNSLVKSKELYENYTE